MTARAWTVALGAVALSACGSSAQPGLAPADRARLHADVAAVRRDVQAGQPAAARAAAAALRDQLTAFARAGRLNTADAARLQTAASHLQAELPQSVASPARPSAPAATTPPAPADAHGKGKGKGHDHGKPDNSQGDGGD